MFLPAAEALTSVKDDAYTSQRPGIVAKATTLYGNVRITFDLYA